MLQVLSVFRDSDGEGFDICHAYRCPHPLAEDDFVIFRMTDDGQARVAHTVNHVWS